ncbi:MAG: radical SAM protein [Gammaproteobacteria bacterium]|nr:radical SAM protein [Gammaproteobacteria bacterium]
MAGDYGAPLFVAWQLSNRCSAACLACCEESGPDKAWKDELSRGAALDLAQRIVEAQVPYVAFGGGEPLAVPHCWDIFDLLSEADIAIKIETDGRHIDEAAADRLAALAVQCIQVSVDGATAATHQRVRPGSNFNAAITAIERLVERGLTPQITFVPNRLNLHEITATYDLAVRLGCEAFVTGPMMRIGRAATNWEQLRCGDDDWHSAVQTLREHARTSPARIGLSIYPWDILTEMKRRLENPQAMLLIVPNGKIKLLNALPFAPADLRKDSLARAWRAYQDAWRAPEVQAFIAACQAWPALLRHANETWTMGTEPARAP